jgi:hypothetical protein
MRIQVKRILVGLIGVQLIAGCGDGSGIDAPLETIALTACTELAADEQCADDLHPAIRFFWNSFHAGRYEDIPDMLDRLGAAVDDHPDDADLTRYTALSHAWRLGENARLGTVTPEIVESATLVVDLFARAVEQDPTDPRAVAFLGVFQFVLGDLFRNVPLLAEGRATLERAADAWLEFSYFPAGYVRTPLPADSAEFQLALERQWLTLDACVNRIVDRTALDLRQDLWKETVHGRKRACWNSWIAPHNDEGFFLNLGDTLVKSGQPDVARRAYKSAQLMDSYERWPFRHVLEDRIANAEANVTNFNQDISEDGKRLMFNSTYACMACHQASEGESRGAWSRNE